jgi:hypothetical protein
VPPFACDVAIEHPSNPRFVFGPARGVGRAGPSADRAGAVKRTRWTKENGNRIVSVRKQYLTCEGMDTKIRPRLKTSQFVAVYLCFNHYIRFRVADIVNGWKYMKRSAVDGSLNIRTGTIEDLFYVKALYGQLSNDISNIERDYRRIVEDPNSDCLILQNESGPGGMVIFHFTMSLSLGKSMEIDEIMIDERHRDEGFGSFAYPPRKREIWTALH